MTYSPATTAHSKRKCICSPIRTSVESKTTNSQRAKLENKKSYPPNTTTQPIFKWTSSPPKALDESGNTNLQRAMDKQSCCPTRITDTKWTYEFPSRTLDQTETPKSLGEKGKSHVVLCEKNPDNIWKQAPLKSKEAPITLGTLPPRASRSEVSIHADVAPPRMPAERSTGTGARPSSVNQTTTKGDAGNTRFSPNGTRETQVRKVPVLQKAFSKGPLACVYCGQAFTKEEIETHFEACKQNLDNVHTEEYRRRDEETLPGATAQVGCPRTKGALTFCIDPELREVPEDSRVWLQCLSSGNVFAAFAAFEQSCSGKNLSESAMYTQFVFALVDSKLFELVKDILEHPCQTQPLDCLMVALFARVSLPRKMWAKRIQEVTWNDVLKYLPSVLASRVQKKNAMSYLQNYPVFLEERGSSHAIDKFSGTKRNSAEAPQSSNSTKPVSPANDVIPALRFLRPTGHMGSS